MNNLINLLEGKKSYIFAVLVALYGLLKVTNVLSTTADVDVAVLALLGSLFGLSVSSKVERHNTELKGMLKNNNQSNG